MTAYKLTEDVINRFNNKIQYEKNRLLVRYGTEVILLATPTLGTKHIDSFSINTLSNQGILEEVELRDEKWILPHLYKPVRLLLEREADEEKI